MIRREAPLIYEELCLEQAEIIDRLSSQVDRLLTLLKQYTDIEEEEEKFKQIEKRISQ
jgi:hypothetical protein